MKKYQLGSFTVFSLSALVALSWAAAPSYAGKLDLNSLQGTYDLLSVYGKTSFTCPDPITVTYDAAKATLDGVGPANSSMAPNGIAFHFENIDKGEQPANGGDGIETDPDHAAYAYNSTETYTKSHSISYEIDEHVVTSDTSQNPIFPEPFDPTGPLNTFNFYQKLTVSYDADKGLLSRDGETEEGDTNVSCRYQKRGMSVK